MRLLAWVWAMVAFLPLAARGDSSPRRVILISIDTLSADHMGVYGYFRDTTPFLYKFASESVNFESAYSQATHTLASHFSIFTGVYPDTHGIASGMPSDRLLSPALLTMTEYLKGEGYRTAWVGTVTDPNLNLARGLGRGFDRTVPLDFGVKWERARLLRDELGNLASGKSFVFLHTYSVHDPYCPPAPLDRLFDPSYTKNVENTCDLPGPDRRQSFFRQFDLSKPPDRQHLIALYDGGVRAIDDAVRELFDRLKELGLYNDALIIVTSDHGEAFGERGYYLHLEPSREETHVPLIVKIPGQAPRRIREGVLSIDILPMVLELTGIRLRSPIQGASLLPLVRGKPWRRPEPGYARGLTFHAIWDQKWKFMTGGLGDQLYDLENDPFERENVVAAQAAVAAQKKAELDAFRVRNQSNAPKITVAGNPRTEAR